LNQITNDSFEVPVIGTDPVTKGKFTIQWAHMLLTIDEDDNGGKFVNPHWKASGKIQIEEFSPEKNPLYDIAEVTPLRLQGLVASVDFGSDKRFIRFDVIKDYTPFPSINGSKSVELDVVFEILDNLEYLEHVRQYMCDHLIWPKEGI